MSRHPIASAAGALAAAGAATVAYASMIERRAYALRRIEVPVLSEDASAFRVLHISDLHLAPWQRDRVRWVRELADTQPDLVINTGDNYGHRDAFGALREALEPLLAVPGAFVYGSNDYFTPRPKNPAGYLFRSSHVARTTPDIDTTELTHLLVDAGWHNLNNRAAVLDIAGSRVALVGTGDAHNGHADLELLARNLTASPADADLLLGVTHAPYRAVLDAFTTLGADVVLAGHTHGGQIQLPFVGALTTNCDLPTAFANGLHTWHAGDRSTQLHVSAGLGTSIYAPVRLGVRPEATLLTLVPRARTR